MPDGLKFVGEILLVLGLVAANGFFVAAEFALVKIRASQLRPMKKTGGWRVKFALQATEHLDVLVLSALRPRPHPTHLHLAASLEEAARIGAPRTLLTHMGHEMPHAAVSEALPPGVELAYDGLVLDLSEDGSAP